MFSLIRGVIIVGLIFYFSPVRDPSGPEHQGPGAEQAATSSSVPGGASFGSDAQEGAQEGAWSRIVASLKEEVVRTAIHDKAQGLGLRPGDEASWPLARPNPKSASADTVRSPDRDAAAARANPSQSVRCVYRCDGAE